MDELVLLKELIAIGLAGVFYSKDVFDTERYERIQVIAKQLIAQRSNLTREQAGVVGQAKRLIMIQDRNLHNPGHSPLTILKCFIECDYQSQNFQANVETLAAEFFAPDDLPELFEAKSSYQQIALCHEAYQAGERWQVLID